MRQSLNLILTFILAVAFLASCSSRKPSLSDVKYPYEKTFEAVETCYGEWSRLRVPVTVNLRSPKNFKISGVATMARDSSINISLRMFGMEVAVLDLTPDSLVVAEKHGKQYLSIPLADFLGRYGFTPANFQDLLTGRVFILGQSELTPASASEFKVIDSKVSPMYILRPKKQPSGATYLFSIGDDNDLGNLTITPDGHDAIGIPYRMPVMTARGRFEEEVEFTLPVSKGNVISVTLEWNWDKARFDDDVEIKPFKLGAGYRAINKDDLLKAL